MGGVVVMEELPTAPPPATVSFAHAVTVAILGTFGARMAAVFTLSATTAGLRTGVIPKWLAGVGYVVALLLLLTPPDSGLVPIAVPRLGSARQCVHPGGHRARVTRRTARRSGRALEG